MERNQPGPEELARSRREYAQQLLSELFDFKPMLRQIQYLQKLWDEHSDQLLGTLKTQLSAITLPLQTEFIEVSSKFENQLRQLIISAPDAEEDEHLQERIKKAAEYFSEKLLQHVETPFSEATFDSDNKAVRKSFNDAGEKLRKEIHTKKVCLNLCKSGFSIKTYLETKSKAAIEAPEPGHKGSSASSAGFTMHPEFYAKLKKWRNEKADLLNVEISRVLPQKTMLGIVQSLPYTKDGLKAVQGMGGTRMQQFGRELLELLIAYRRQKGLDLPVGAETEIKMAGLSTQEMTFEMYKSGKSVPEIAEERHLAVSTIETHLAHFVGTGELDVEKLIDLKKLKVIQEYIQKHREYQAGPIRAGLENEYTFSEIRLVLKHLESRRSGTT